jgi:hypothetical protein
MRNLRSFRGTTTRACLIGMALFGPLTFAVTVRAEQLHDPALPTVSSESLHQLSDSRTRQQIMAERQSHFPGAMRLSLSDDRFIEAIVQRTP